MKYAYGTQLPARANLEKWGLAARSGRFSRPLLLTPLIDVVFLVTLFFVINTSFTDEREIVVNLPASNASPQQESSYLVVTIHSDERVLLDGEEISLEALTLALQREGGRVKGVQIEGDRSIPYETLVQVLDRVQAAKISSVSLLTTSERQVP